MSILQLDSAVLNQGRKAGLPKDSMVGLRDKVVMKLLDKCQDEDHKLGWKVVQMWRKHHMDKQPMTYRHEIFTKWDEFLEDTEQLYDGTSSLHLPMPLVVLRTFHARMFQALFSIDPPFVVKPMQEMYQDSVRMIDGLMSWTLKEWCNWYEGVEEVGDRWLWNWCAFGSGILKCRWDRTFTRYVDVVTVQRSGPPQYNVTIDPDTGMVIEVETPVVVNQDVEQPVTEITFDGPVLEYINAEDFACIMGGTGNGSGSDIQRADCVIHRKWYTSSELLSLADQGVFDFEMAEYVIKAGPGVESAALGNEVKQEQEIHAGEQVLNTTADHDRYEILEAYVNYDINDDGINESIVIWVDVKTTKILRATYLHRVQKDGKRPFGKIDFIHREGHGYAMGLLEILHPMSIELDFIHNIKIDSGLFAAIPFGFYRAASGMQAEKLRVKPGDFIPVDDPEKDIHIPNMGDRSGFFREEEQNLMGMIERVTSISDINTATLGRQGVGRTATGVSALMNENNSNLDIFIKRMQRGWKQVLRILFGMLQQRMPDGLEFRVTGEDGREYFETLDRADIQVKVDFALEANSMQSNRQIQQDMAQAVLAQCMNPLFIQLGIVEPDGIYEALKDYFISLGKRDFTRFIKKSNLKTSRVLEPQEELRRLVAGWQVDVTPEMDHQGFMDLVDRMSQSGAIPSDKSDIVQSQYQAHAQMQQVMEAQAAQIQQSMQQQANSMGAGGGAMPGAPPQLNSINAMNGGQGPKGQIQPGPTLPEGDVRHPGMGNQPVLPGLGYNGYYEFRGQRKDFNRQTRQNQETDLGPHMGRSIG